MKKTSSRLIYLVFVCICLLHVNVRAADLPPIVNPLKGSMNQLIKGANNYIDLTENVDTSKVIKPVNRITNIISFYVREDTAMFFSSNFIAKVKYRLFYKNAAGTLDSLTNQWLEINYRGATGDSAYDQRKSFYFYNAHYTKIVIDSFYTNVSWSVKPALILMNEMRVNLDYKFECTTNGISNLNKNLDYTQDDELYVFWNKPEGADEFDLEWSYIDSSALDNYKTSGNYDPLLIFDNNATRVSVSDSLAYRIPLLYDYGGILFYRVRPIQNKLNGKRIEGVWAGYSGGADANWYYSFAGHQRPLNWQATTSFAEEGKRKSVVQYFDGTLRSRQTVTKDNTSGKTVVAETFYDHQGRPVIQVLPAPTLNSIIAYTQNFNRMNTGEYDKSRYDTLISPSAYCSTAADTMSVLSGASQYYSQNNPEKNTGFNKFIPDAKGYPFTETQYTQDNTGRINKQSGVGPDHKMGSGHETKYFYGSASQRELDVLFGTEVGNYSHYFKNMVRDANGQYSVSYVDMKGRTIATALAGKLNDSIKLNNLPTYDSVTITEKIIDSNTNTIKGLTMEASKGLVVTKSGTHRFQYSLLPDSITVKNCNNVNICYDCYYDLEVTISGDCNNQQFGGQVVKIIRNNLTINPDTVCNVISSFPGIDTSLFLTEGSYLITKKLTVSKFAVDYYRDSIFLVKNLCKTKEDFIEEQLDSIRSQSVCEITCTTCTTNLGTWTTFRNNYMIESGYLFSDTANHRNEAWAAYQEETANCKEICDKTGLHDDIRGTMLRDMMAPSGQYADTSKIDAVSIFAAAYFGGTNLYKSVIYYDENGKKDSVRNSAGILVPPHTLELNEFVANFKPSWAEALLIFHPEKCRLDNFELYNYSHEWDRRFLAVETFKQAKDSGFVNPTGSTSFPYAMNYGVVKDPLFNQGIYDPIYSVLISDLIQDSLIHYRSNNDGGWLTMWAMSSLIGKCKPGDQTCANLMKNNANAFDTTAMCEGELDMAWRSFREMYMREKQEIMYRLTQKDCDPLPAFNIMKKHTLRFPDPSSYDASFNYSNVSDTTAAKQRFKDSTYSGYVDNCKAYAEQWLLQFTQCPQYDTANIRSEALQHLINVCVKGSDIWHPYGSSSISPDSSYTFNSFQDVMNWYNANHSITDQVQCNAYIITNPPAYGKQSSFANKPIWNKPDSCDCAKITELKTNYLANQSSYTSFSNYMFKKHGTTISNASLDSLVNLCNGTITCNYLVSPIVLPPAMQCGVKDACVNCITIDTLYLRFKIDYPSIIPVYDDSQDTLQQKKNKLFASYLNNKLGFSFTHIDYLQFMDSCKFGPNNPVTFDTSSVTCAELDNFIANYYHQYLKPSAGYIDYDLRTFAGNLTPDEGPKGVFDVNGNLIGNTVSGTVTQIKNSYASIWNSSPVDSIIGTLSVLENGKFRLTLKPDQTAPCNGIVGMRYYQFDFKSDTINSFNVGEGSYVDFGDSSRVLIPMQQNVWPLPNTYIPILSGTAFTRQAPDLIRPRGAWVHHYYTDTSLKTVTVYHTDVKGRVGFDVWNIGVSMTAYKLRHLSNIRGYFPQELIELSIFSTRDSTLNNFSQIANFNQISTTRRFMLGNSGPSSSITAPENVDFEPFPALPNLNHIRFYQGHLSAPPVKAVDFHKTFRNLPANYARLSWLEMYEYGNDINEDSINFTLPNLVYLDYTSVNITSTQIDNIFIQIANGTQRDTGRVFILSNSNNPRTSASDAAIATLISKYWDIWLNGSWINYRGNTFPATATAQDSIPFTNQFTEYFNQSFSTSLSFHQLEKFYLNKCGKALNYCSPPLKDSTLCGKSAPIFLPVDNITGICEDSTALAIIKGTILYEAYVDSLKNSFEDKYLNKCLQAYKYETFTVTRPVSEFHYTLYYYDQAGNLVKTVPPAGVQPIYRQTWLDSVANFRINKQMLAPAHTLHTTYRYNTLNQVVAQKTPDAGISNFWYDRLGRLVISQNAKQFGQATKNYSYTLYDALGRITEVGQKPQATAMTNTISRNQTQLNSWLTNASYVKQQITKTLYDIPIVNTGVNANIVQRNLRNRVSYTMYWDADNNPDWNNAVFYSYDIHGNVDTLLNDYGSSLYSQTENPMNLHGSRWKKMVYRYDLISGKVNHVAYQPRMRDAVYHRYSYDAENRLILAEVSTDSLYWDKDARYEYYRHGPLVRSVLGHQSIQGVDYAYTLQGWLKGVNGSVTNPQYDMGADGYNSNVVARDTFGFSLYYHGNDYRAINDANRFAGLRDKLVTASVHRPLFNGNISAMAMNIGVLNKPVVYNYSYDQLNRLVAMDVFNGTNTGVNLWSSTFTSTSEYKEAISYDANGNILRYLRQGTGSKIGMDSLTYNYYTGTNKLNYVKDNIGNNEYRSSNSSPYDIEDINNQSTSNYTYDEIGNLISDNAESITTAVGGIKWNVYGKITEINKASTGNGSVKKITYTYDAAGNRISKKVEHYNNGGTDYSWYVRDASGNTMSVYSYTDSLILSEQHIYGSSRLGILTPGVNLERSLPSATSMPILSGSGNFGTFIRGNKLFELSNHLGNVLVVLSDKKRGVQNGTTGSVLYYLPLIKSAQDYYPFGMVMPGRKFNATSLYRYGFNGKENDNEVKGDGNQQDYGMRIYDTRLGRFLSMDPLQADYPELTPYQFAGNNPIENVDLDGKEVYDFRLDLDDKGQATGFSYLGQNKHGIGGWSIWNIFGTHIPAVDIYQNGKYLGRYSFNTESQGGFTTLANFAGNKEFRDNYIANNQTVEQAHHQIATDVGQMIEDGFRQAGVVKYAISRAETKPQAPANANNTASKTEEKTKSANSGTATDGAKKPASTGTTTPPGNQAATLVANKQNSLTSEQIVHQKLQSQLGANEAILPKPRIYIGDGSSGKYALPDFAVYNKNTGQIIRLVDAKNGNATLSRAQQQVNQHGGVFRGSSRAREAKPQTVGTNSIQVERTNVVGGSN